VQIQPTGNGSPVDQRTAKGLHCNKITKTKERRQPPRTTPGGFINWTKYKLSIIYMEQTNEPIPIKSFADRLEVIEEELRLLIQTPEYRQMILNGYIKRADLGLGDALLAVQQCFNEYYVNEICLSQPKQE